MDFKGGLEELSATYLHFTVNSIAAAGPAAKAAVIAPAGTLLAVGTVASHVARVTAHTTDDAGSKVLALGTVVLAVTNLATVLASLVLVVSEGTVEGGQLTKLVPLELVLALGNGGSLSERVSN